MTTEIGYWSPLTNQSFTLKVFTMEGTPVLDIGVSLNEVSPISSPGYYQGLLPTALSPGGYRSRVYRGSALIDDGVLFVNPLQSLAVIDDFSSRIDLRLSALEPEVSLSQLTEESEPGLVRFTAGALSQGPQACGPGVFPEAGVLVNEFSPLAQQQLAGLSISITQPEWTVRGFDRPIVRGDSYNGVLALSMTLTGWPGPDLTEAESILLTANRLPTRDSQFQWPVVAEQTSTGFVLKLELLSLQTDHPAGLYEFDVEARWEDGTVHTLIGPDATLRIVQDQTI